MSAGVFAMRVSSGGRSGTSNSGGSRYTKSPVCETRAVNTLEVDCIHAQKGSDSR